MLVCICKGVSDRTIRKELARGAQSLEDIQRNCRAGTDCGSCVRQIAKMLVELKPPATRTG